MVGSVGLSYWCATHQSYAMLVTSTKQGLDCTCHVCIPQILAGYNDGMGLHGWCSPVSTSHHRLTKTLYWPCTVLNLFLAPPVFLPFPQPDWWSWLYWLNPLSYCLYGIIASQLGDVTDMIDFGDGSEPVTVGRVAWTNDYCGCSHTQPLRCAPGTCWSFLLRATPALMSLLGAAAPT